MEKLNIPVGISDFREIRENGYYYIDKTFLIYELLKTPATKVTLITRPRRFGKTLGMSMLADFFDIRKESSSLFEGLDISEKTNICNEWLNQYPVIFLSLKDIDGLTFKDAYGQLVAQIADLYKEYTYLLECAEIDEDDKKIFLDLKAGKADKVQVSRSFSTLMKMLQIYYQKPVILLLE